MAAMGACVIVQGGQTAERLYSAPRLVDRALALTNALRDQHADSRALSLSAALVGQDAKIQARNKKSPQKKPHISMCASLPRLTSDFRAAMLVSTPSRTDAEARKREHARY